MVMICKKEASKKVLRKKKREGVTHLCVVLHALYDTVSGRDKGNWSLSPSRGEGCSFAVCVMLHGPERCSGPTGALALGAGSGFCCGC